MGLTNITQVRSHLNRLNIGEGQVSNQQVRLVGQKYVALPHTHIVTNSETVKAVRSHIPTLEKVVLDSGPAALSCVGLVPDSVVCASDESLSQIYEENVDFVIDYSAGKISRISEGNIASGSQVAVWYLYYYIFQRDIDYSFDFQGGQIKRLATGSIEDNQEVLVDYYLGSSELSDSEIEQCISEAEAEIEHLIASEYRESTDPALQAAATFLSLSILCRNAVGLAVSAVDSDKPLSTWMDLSQSYYETAMRLLKWFRPAVATLNPPRLS